MRWFFLTDGNEVRDPQMMAEFPGIIPVLAPKGPKHLSMSHGFSTILDLAACQREFEPFVILENDVKKYSNLTEIKNVPADADLIYIGITKWGMTTPDMYSGAEVLYVENYNESFVRVFNLTSMHGIMICSVRGLLAYQRAMSEAFFRNIPTDIPLAYVQPYLKVYALRRPMVYQAAAVGGHEADTKIELVDVKDNKITDENINSTYFTTRVISHRRPA